MVVFFPLFPPFSYSNPPLIRYQTFRIIALVQDKIRFVLVFGTLHSLLSFPSPALGPFLGEPGPVLEVGPRTFQVLGYLFLNTFLTGDSGRACFLIYEVPAVKVFGRLLFLPRYGARSSSVDSILINFFDGVLPAVSFVPITVLRLDIFTFFGASLRFPLFSPLFPSAPHTPALVSNLIYLSLLLARTPSEEL